MNLLELYVENTTLKIISGGKTAQNCKYYDYAKFTFASDWDGYGKTILFWRGSSAYRVLLDSAGMCAIPWELIVDTGIVQIGVVGIKDDTVVNTITPVAFVVSEGAYREGNIPTDPTPSIYEQIVSATNETQLAVEYVVSQARSGAFNGKGIFSVRVNEEKHLIVTMSDGEIIDAGEVPTVQGERGERGIQGERGEQGIQGDRGIQGVKGDTGETGAQGIQGEQGIRGETGPRGEQGLKGDKGDKGDTGATGAAGATGSKGDKGDTGNAGFSPTVDVKTNTSTEYVLTVTNEASSYDTPNLKGQNGEGSGDMLASTYDPDGKARDIFAYADTKAPADHTHTAEAVGAAASVHTHTKAQITDFPTSMTPAAHKATHATGGEDALSPADIGAETSGAAALAVSAHNSSESAHQSLFAGKASTATYTATLAVADWVGSAAPYTQTVIVSGVLFTDNPIIDIVQSATQAIAEAELEGWGMVSKIVTGSNSITATCYADKPTVALNVQIKVVR